MSGIFALTEEVREKIQTWRDARMTGDEIVTMLKHAYPSAFSGDTDFATKHELDQLVFSRVVLCRRDGAPSHHYDAMRIPTGGGYLRAAYNYPERNGIYIHDAEHGTEVYRCTNSGYFTFDKEVILQPEMVTWARAHYHILDPVDFRQRFMQMFFPSGRADFDALRWVDIIAGGEGYDYSRATYPGTVGEWQYRRADEENEDSEPIFYRVTAAGAMTCSVELLPVGDARSWRAPLWYAYLRAECGAFEPSDDLQRVIADLDACASARAAPQANHAPCGPPYSAPGAVPSNE